MSRSTFFVSKPALRNMKRGAQRVLPDVGSSHLSEGIASALGFKTNAALCTAFKKADTVEVQKPDNFGLVERLQQIGYENLPKSVKPLPDLKHSYSPFRRYPLRSKFGPRWHAWRNLLVSAINAGLEQQLFGLSPCENWWVGAAPESQRCKRGIYHFTLDRDLPAVATVDAITGDELSIYVFVNPRQTIDSECSFIGLDYADASAFGWLERRCGTWIQDGGATLSCRRALQPRLAQMSITPKGYSDIGSFFL